MDDRSNNNNHNKYDSASARLGRRRSSSSSSDSEEEDGDETWRAAIRSVAVEFDCASKHTSKNTNRDTTTPDASNGSIKYFQARLFLMSVYVPETLLKSQGILHQAQELLHRHLEKTLKMVSRNEQTFPHSLDGSNGENDVRLFKKSPRGFVLKSAEDTTSLPSRRKKRPRMLSLMDRIHEKSKAFKVKINNVAVDGDTILVQADNARAKAFARLQEREATALKAAKKEEERVSLLKRKRGEKWLPLLRRIED